MARGTGMPPADGSAVLFLLAFPLMLAREALDACLDALLGPPEPNGAGEEVES